jgi:hypothetical protein
MPARNEMSPAQPGNDEEHWGNQQLLQMERFAVAITQTMHR